MVQDLVCGMRIKEEDAVGTSDYIGTTYYFCSPGCKEAFEKEPEKYIKPVDDSEEHHHH